jgi:hypothetical protein
MLPAEVDAKLVLLRKIANKIRIENWRTSAAFHQSRPRGGAVGSDGWVGPGIPMECGKGSGTEYDRVEGRQGKIRER